MRGSLILGMTILIFSLLVLILPYCEGKIQLSFFRWIINFCSWTVYERRDVFRKKIHKSDDLFTHLFQWKKPQEDKRIKTLFSFLFFIHTTEKNEKRIRFFRPLGYEYDLFLNVWKKIVCEIIKNDGYLRPNSATYYLQRNEL